MRLINDLLLKDRYDVIVVGAGLGGMTAACLLAKKGLSVLLIEQQDKPGGSCTSFRRKGITFDVGTAMLYGFGDRGFKPFRFLINEIEEPVDVIAHQTLARMTFEGHPITFWPDIERFLQDLDRRFPGEEAGLRAFYGDLYKMYAHIVLKNEVIVPPSEFSSRQNIRSLLSGPVQMIKLQKLLSISVRTLLDQYFHGEEIINFFDKLCSAYCYCTADETPAILAATMFIDNHIGGVYYPAGGAQMLPNKLEKAFERMGGQMLYHCLVDEILIDDGRAYGVRLENGVEVFSTRVIANATVWNIYGKLVRPQHIPPERLAWVQNLEPTFPSMTLYLVVNRSALPDQVLPWEVFIENRAIIDNSDLTLYINALVDDTLCPPGKLVITVIAPNLEKWPALDSPEYKSAAYQQQKHSQAQLMLDQIEQHFPGFSSKIETMIVGTPTTIERYLLKNWGAVGGPKNKIGQQMLKRLHARSEWKNLYLCGDSTVMATGAPATVVSGVGAANMVLRDLHLPEYDRRKFTRQYVEFVETPYRRPAFDPDGVIDPDNAWLAAAECQGCQEPACVRDCPTKIDIPGILRRMEAKNYIGAARELQQKSPFGSLCGTVCPAEELCERHCYHRSFSERSVRIGDLMHWVSRSTGDRELLQQPKTPGLRQRAVILGGNLNGMTCAYYLALAGCEVEVYDQPDQPLMDVKCSEHDLRILGGLGIHYHGGQAPTQPIPTEILSPDTWVYIASDEWRIYQSLLPAQAEMVKVQSKPIPASATNAIAEGRRAAFVLVARIE